MVKFGKVLNDRSFGREAVLRVRQIVNGSANVDRIELDFKGVELLTPSFADEFIRGVRKQYPPKDIEIKGIEDNPVIKDTLKELKLL